MGGGKHNDADNFKLPGKVSPPAGGKKKNYTKKKRGGKNNGVVKLFQRGVGISQT